MAIKKFIKVYNILKDDIDSKGNINPDAALYPLFASQYIDNATGKHYSDLPPEQIKEHLSDEDTPYDNSTNAHPDRAVWVTEKQHTPYNEHVTARTSPNMKRGFSVLAYSNRDKRSGKDYFANWSRLSKNTHTIDYFPDFENTPKYTFYNTPQKDRGTLVNILHSDIKETPGSRFNRVPLIITAEDSDIIDIDDVRNDNYDPLRDFPSEQQVKRIIKRSVIPDKYLDTQVIDNKTVALLKDVLNTRITVVTHILNTLSQLQEFPASNIFILLFDELDSACNQFGNSAHMDGLPFNKRSLATKAFYRLISSGVIPNIEAATSSVENCGYKLQFGLYNLKDMYEDNDEDFDGLTQELFQVASDLESKSRYALDLYTKAIKALDGLQQSNVNLPVGVNYDFSKVFSKGGAFDWYDDSTSSDERIKNIIDTGRQVTLSDKQQKYILDDFNKFCNSRQKHNNLLSGIKEVGQW